VHDWIKECHPDFKEVSTKTVYNFVLYVREKYRLPKVFTAREFSKVPELTMAIPHNVVLNLPV
jgi:hypothetical protein